MPQYIMLVNFTDQGLKGVKDVPNRQDKSRETAKKFGVQRKTVWMTFGPYDFVHLYEAPNDEAMAKFVMTLASFGNLRTTVMRAWDETEHLQLIRELARLTRRGWPRSCRVRVFTAFGCFQPKGIASQQRLLRCGISTRPMSAWGQNPNPPLGLLCQLPPAADFVQQAGPSWI